MTKAQLHLLLLLLASPTSAWAQATDPESDPETLPEDEPLAEGEPEAAAPEDEAPAGDTAPSVDGVDEVDDSAPASEEPPADDSVAEGEASTSETTGSGEEDRASAVVAAEETTGAKGEETTAAPEAVPATARTPREGSIPYLRGAEAPTQRGPIGLEPGAPQASSIAGGVTPAFGARPMSASDWLFDVHGYLQLPLRVGINEREAATLGQKVTVLHTPPVIPGALETFEYTGTVPDPWAQMNFSFGNRDVTATVIIAARTVSNANGYYNPADQLGINDAFLTFHPQTKGSAEFAFHVGAFANRYGIMGEYDSGRYGTPLVARLSGVGGTGTGKFDLGPVDLTVEAGIMGPLTKAPVGVEPAGWNGFSDANAGSTFALHGHAALGFGDAFTVGAHAIHAFAQDDRATSAAQQDGSIDVIGADLRLSMKQFGHLYLGYGHTNANTARSVSGVIRVLNAPGGLGLMEEYFGLASSGSGKLNTFGAQYDLSLGNLLRHPEPYHGNGPDLVVSGFTIGTAVDTEEDTYDGVFKLKYGGEATYSLLPWMATGVRYDRVIPDTSDASQTHAILSPRLIFKSNWASNDQVMLQYSRYFYGSNSAPVVGYPPAKDATVVPDDDVITLSASIWW